MASAKKQMTRDEIAKETNLAQAYVFEVLRRLRRKEFIMSVKIWGRGSTLTYLLTEKGFELYKKAKEGLYAFSTKTRRMNG